MNPWFLLLMLAVVVFPAVASAQPDAPPSGSSVPSAPWGPRGSTEGRPAAATPVSAFVQSREVGLEISVGGGLQTGGGSSPVQAPTLWVINGMDRGSADDRGALLDPAGNAAIGHNFTPYTFDPFNLEARVGYRFHPSWSVGVFFSYARYLANDGADSGDAPDGTSALAREQLSVGAYGRYYPTRFSRRLQPWLELGVGLNFDGASYTRPTGQAIMGGQPETGNVNLSQYGIIVPVKVGLDWRLAPSFSVGPMIGYSRVFPVSGCVEVDVDQLSPVPGTNTCGPRPPAGGPDLATGPFTAREAYDAAKASVKNYGYSDFFGGIFVKLTFNAWTR